MLYFHSKEQGDGLEETTSLLAIGWQVVMSFFPGRRKKKSGLEEVCSYLGAANWDCQQRNQKLNLILSLINEVADPRLKEAFDL